jgi:hypothetical protein
MRLITDIMRELRRGRVLDIASERLQEVVRAVDLTGKSGEVTITLKVKPEKGGGAAKTLQPSVKAKVPEVELSEGIFFSDDSGDLHRTDPDQREMFKDSSADDQAQGRA